VSLNSNNSVKNNKKNNSVKNNKKNNNNIPGASRAPDGRWIIKRILITIFQVLLVLVTAVLSGETDVPCDADGHVDIEAVEKKLSPAISLILNIVRYSKAMHCDFELG
jgi:hypothetical protein